MRSNYLAFWLALALLAAAVYAGYKVWQTSQSLSAVGVSPGSTHAAADDEGPAALPDGPVDFDDFEFTERSGRIVRLGDLRGRIWVCSFFFIACPGPCLIQNTVIADLQKEFAASDVTWLSITCDPKNDTPAALQKYADRFRADPERWLFLTGPMPTVTRLAQDVFGVPIGEAMHSSRMMLIDAEGNIVGKFGTQNPADVIAMRQKLRKLLGKAEPASPAEPSAPAGPAGAAVPATATAAPSAATSAGPGPQPTAPAATARPEAQP